MRKRMTGLRESTNGYFRARVSMAFFKERTFMVCECECPIGFPTSPDDVDNG